MKAEINIRRIDSAQGLELAAPHVHNVTAEIWRDTMDGTWVTLSQRNYQGKQKITLTGWQFEQVAAKVAARMAEFKREDAEPPATPEEIDAFARQVDELLKEDNPAEAPQSSPLAPDRPSTHPDTAASS